MRNDSDGMFWHDAPRERANSERAIRQIEIPDTGWTTPAQFPRLGGEKILGFDTETYDPNLLEKGPGDCRNDGHVVGISVATEDAKWYFPIRHEVEPAMNMDVDNVKRWFQNEVGNSKALKVGANVKYDLGWLAAEGISVRGPFYDVQIAEVLINENKRSYSLDNLANEYLDMGKTDDELYRWLYASYGGKEGRAQAANIYRSPPRLCGPYAEDDAHLPMRIMQKQARILQDNNLFEVTNIEMRLMPMLVAMRRLGVRVDSSKAEQLEEIFSDKIKEEALKFEKISGVPYHDAKETLVAAFDKCGIEYPKTAKGNPSFAKAFLEGHPSELAQCLTAARKWEKSKGTFIDGYLIKHAHEGRIHAEINQLRIVDEQGERGTIGRFSYSNPNLQNIPARDPDMKKLIRGLFLPDEDDDWISNDYSQIEYRLLTHFAIGEGAKEARAMYQTNPATDFHDSAQERIKIVTGIELGRKPTKNFNFGMVYGMSKKTLIAGLGVAEDIGENLYGSYHKGLPFIKTTYDKAMQVAEERGYIKTLLGRRRHYNLWEPQEWKLKAVISPSEDKQAVIDQCLEHKSRRGACRVGSFTALNNILQLSSADIIKKAMVMIWEGGLCDILKPLIQVHDELNWSKNRSPEADEALAEARRIMETAVKVDVPLLVSEERGEDWGNLE